MKTFVFGLQRTATNYVHSLLWKNFGAFAQQPSDSEEILWKHTRDPDRAVKELPTFSLTVLVGKDPVMWADSLARKPMDAHNIFEGGDKEPFIQMYSKKVPLYQVVNVWNDYNAAWSRWVSSTGVIEAVKHETLLDDSKRESWLDNISAKYDLEFKNVDKFDNKETPLSRKFTEAVKQAYINKVTEFITPEQAAFIESNADMETYEKTYT